MSSPLKQFLPGLLASLLWIAMPAPVLPEPLFEAALGFPVGFAPYSLASGDLNSDGLPDVVTANNGGDVSVLLGVGDGTFEATQSIPLNDLLVDITVDDLNGDADLDIVAVTYSSVAVLLGNGKGGFEEPAYFAVDGPYSAAVGDFNGDGAVDLVTANILVNTVSLLAGDGSGKFEPLADLAASRAPYDIATGDLDGDGISDVVVANFDAGSISVFRSTADFLHREDYPVGANPAYVSVGDVTGDGRPDVVVPCFFSHWVAVLTNDSSGRLKPAARYPTGDFPGSTEIADINHDGKPDLLVTNEITSQSISVLLGTGSGTFGVKIDTDVGTVTHGIAVQDFDQDGEYDLATTSQHNDLVLVFLGDGSGVFRTRQDHEVGLEPRSVAVGDLDGDARLDLVTANDNGNSVTVLHQLEGGWSRADYPAGVGAMAVAVGDLTGEGRVDVVTANWEANTVSVLLGNGDGTLQPSTNWGAFDSPFAIAISDLNADGKPDLVAGNRAGGGGNVAIFLGRGDGTFQSAVRYGTSGPSYGVAIGDVDGDSKPDIATANFFSGVSVLRGNGNGTFSFLGAYAVPGLPRGIAMSDLNHDGNQDLITANVGSHTISVLLGNGTGAFPTVVSYTVNFGPTFVAAGDLTGDDHVDLAVANASSTVVSVLRGVGDGTFEPRMDFAASRNPHGVAIGDLNGDALPDLVTADVIAHSVSILRHTGGKGDFQITGVESNPEPRDIPAPRISPNPLNPSGAMMFRTARPGPVDVRVFDVHGRLVRSIALPLTASGDHELAIDGRDTWGNPLASGVYYYSLRTADGIARGRFAVLK